MSSIKSKNSKKKYTRKNKYKQSGRGNKIYTINHFTEKYDKELEELRSYYNKYGHWDLSTLDKIISYESNDNLKYLKYIIKKAPPAVLKHFNNMYNEEYTFTRYERRKLGLANPSAILRQEFLNNLFNNNNKLLNPTQFPPSKPDN